MNHNSHGNSRFVNSSQSGIHHNLQRVVQKHLRHRFRRPFDQHNVEAFEQLLQQLQQWQAPLIFDSGCGTGASTVELAQRHSDCWVIGIDKSAHRLNKPKSAVPENCLYLRADTIDLWRLAQQHGLRLQKHYLLYPNPWPKPQHLQRRWHGSPVFDSLLALGGELELRSNWELYVDEMIAALAVAGISATKLPIVLDTASGKPRQQALTPFEDKYHASGHQLWCCRADLNVTMETTTES